MLTYRVRVPRGLILALILAAALTPLAPDTGSVAEPRIPARIATAHMIADAPTAIIAAGFR